MPGFGPGIVCPEERYSFDRYADWLEPFLHEEVEGSFHLMGNSLGGAVSLLLADRMPKRLETLTLLSCAGVDPPGVVSLYREVERGENPFIVRHRHEYARLLRRIFHAPPRIPGPVGEFLCQEHIRNASWYGRLMGDLHLGLTERGLLGHESLVSLRDVNVPTLVAWGDSDAVFPLAVGRHVAAAVPTARLHVFSGIGHCPHLECPAELASAFAGFARDPVAALARAQAD